MMGRIVYGTRKKGGGKSQHPFKERDGENEFYSKRGGFCFWGQPPVPSGSKRKMVNITFEMKKWDTNSN